MKNINKNELQYHCFGKHYWKVNEGYICPTCGLEAVGKPFYREFLDEGVEEHIFEDGEGVRIYDIDRLMDNKKLYDDGTMVVGDFDEVFDILEKRFDLE